MTRVQSGTAVEAILWDHDGVLVDTEPFFYEATRQVLLPLGIDIPRDHWVQGQAKGQYLEEIVGPERGASLDFRRIRQLRDERYTEFLHTEELALDGAEEVLRDLSGRFRMALVTNSHRRYIDELHGGNTFLDFFETVVTADDCRRGKPDPEPYLTALQRLGLPAGAAVSIEDSEQGLRSATAAGLRCLVVRNAFLESHTFDTAWKVLDSIREVPAVLGV